ncbi:hypothetical protein ACFLTP_02255 [Chloroflexota bacterium]
MVITLDQLDIDKQTVLNNIGYHADCEPTTRINSLVNEYVENSLHLIEPSYSCLIRNVKSVKKSHVVIDGRLVFKSQVVARLLELCDQVAIFTSTIGGHLEEMVSHLAENGLVLKATVLDTIGSVTVERLADFVQERVGKVVGARGLSISRRFSPGYCDWNIEQQVNIFKAMNGNSGGIYLKKSHLMLPQKSISGIIGIGNNEVVNYNPCKTCDRKDCVCRR